MDNIKLLEKQIKQLTKELKEEKEAHKFTKERLTGSYDRNFSLRTGLINQPIDDIINLKNKHIQLQKDNVNG